MFFILSKILSFVTQPTTWIVCLLLFYIIFKKHHFRKKSLLIAISMLLFFTNPYISNYLFKAWEIEPTPLSDLENHDIAVVFSGMTNTEKKPQDRIYFNKAADRIMMAVHLYKIGKVKKILISGGIGNLSGKGLAESETLKTFLLMLDIPNKDIIQEKKANNTYQNAIFTKELIDKAYPNSKLILITSAFHMRRSFGCTNKAGLTCTPFAVDYHTQSSSFALEDLIYPKSSALYNWDVLSHEVIGYLVYKLTGKL